MSVELVCSCSTGGEGFWLKGNLHTHTQRSDGRNKPQEMILKYAGLGYDFLALSDHDMLVTSDGLDDSGMVMIPANEICAGFPHMLHLGARTVVQADADIQKVIDAINADGGLAVLCHPNWLDEFNHYPIELLLSLKDYAGIEIFNGLCIEQPGSHTALDKWDRLLGWGKKVWGFANDDAHGAEQAGRGWTVVRTAERSATAILQAIRSGSFYASCGVEITEITSSGGVLTVQTSNADRIDVYGIHGKRVGTAEGKCITFDASEVASPFIRVHCLGRGGEAAWTQPIYIRGGLTDSIKEQFAKLEGVLRPIAAERRPDLTGKVDDPLWSQAPVSNVFLRAKSGGEPPVTTEMRSMIADRTLYLAFRCQETEPDGMRVQVLRDGDMSTYADDSVEIFLDPAADAAGYLQIMVNADGFVCVKTNGRQQATPQCRAKAARTAEGWTIEIEIPLTGLGASLTPGSRLGLHICRNRSFGRECYLWSWTGRSNHYPAGFASLIIP